MDSLEDMTTITPPEDPYNQPVTILFEDGTPIPITLEDIHLYVTYAIRICINFATQIGASFILLVVLLLLTKSEKRRAPIFILNSLCLALNTIRSILQCLYYTGGFYHPYAFFTGDYGRVQGVQYRIAITAGVLILLLVVCIEISLVLQVRVVCVTLRRVQRIGITIFSVVVALLAIGFRFALTVINARAITNAEDFGHWYWLANATNIVMTISICFFCVIFVSKLGWALLQRRKLGLKQFGPLQIILIMGCQTLIVPAIFSTLQYTTPVPELGSQVLTFVAIFLPLSSLWAAAVVDNQKSSSSAAAAAEAKGATGQSSTGTISSRFRLMGLVGGRRGKSHRPIFAKSNGASSVAETEKGGVELKSPNSVSSYNGAGTRERDGDEEDGIHVT